MAARVEVRRNTRGSWSVYLDGQFISDHSDHASARVAAQQVQRVLDPQPRSQP